MNLIDCNVKDKICIYKIVTQNNFTRRDVSFLFKRRV